MTSNNACLFVGTVVEEPLFRLVPPATPEAGPGAFLRVELLVRAARQRVLRVRCVAYHAVATNLYAQLHAGQTVAVQAHYRQRKVHHPTGEPRAADPADPGWHWVHEFVIESLTFVRPTAAPAPGVESVAANLDEEEL